MVALFLKELLKAHGPEVSMINAKNAKNTQNSPDN
jgi:hypothetical protein